MKWNETWDLSTIPGRHLASEMGKRRRAGNTVPSGRPTVLAPCPKCGIVCSAAERRRTCEKHKQFGKP